jgi:iron complex outermembrane receptor protein
MTALNLLSDVAGLHMKLKTFNYDAKYYLPKMGKLESIVGIQGMHQTNTNLEKSI